jgi:hypothetical protein
MGSLGSDRFVCRHDGGGGGTAGLGLARGLGLGEDIRVGEGEKKGGGGERPSILADALEAVFGAVFMDGGFDAARGVAVVVVTFIALLELAKESLIEITQAAAYAPIYVRLSYQPS